MVRLCYLYTDFQRLVFHAAVLEAGHDPDSFVYITNGYCTQAESANSIRLTGGFKGFQWRRARTLLREIRQCIARLAGEEPFELWLASDRGPVGQFLIRHPNCRRLVVFEDGLANYGVKYPSLSRKMLKIRLYRLRNAICLFPYYWPPMQPGDSPQADQRFALTTHAFPRFPDKEIIQRKHLVDAVVHVGDPVTAPVLSKRDVLFVDIFKDRERAEASRPAVVQFLGSLRRREHFERIIIRPHPGAKGDFVSKSAEAIRTALGVEVVVLQKGGSLEAMLASMTGDLPVIAGLMSSALYVAKIIQADARVYCYKSGYSDRVFSDQDQQARALASLGVQLL